MRRLLLGWALAAAPAALVTAPDAAHAQAGDWGVTRDPFDRTVNARYKAILARNPHDGNALARLREAYRRYRKVELLVEEYEAQLGKNPDDVAAMIVLGRLQRMAGDEPRALEMWQRAVGKKDADVQTWLLIGELQRSAGHLPEARAAYDKALAQATTKDLQKKALRALADLALGAGEIDAANAYFQRFLELDPNNAQLWIERGDAMLAAGKRDVALDSYTAAERFLGGDPARKVEVISRRGQALEAMGKDDEAVVEYRRAIKSAPRGYYLEVELTGRVIDIYRRKQALPALLAAYEKAWPEASRGHFEWDTLGKLYEETGAQDKAIAALKRAVAKASFELETQRRLIALLENSGRDLEAIAQYEAVVRAAPGEARFQLELAERYWRRGQENKGLDTLARLRGRFPSDAGILAAIADLYQRWGKEDLAIAEYERLSKLEPDDPGHLVTLGEQHWQKNDRTRALAVWKRLTTSGKASGFARLAEVMAEHNNPAEALANFDKAIKLDDKHPEFYKGRAGVHESQKRLKEATEDWKKVLALLGTKPTDRVARRDARRHLVAIVARWSGAQEDAFRRDWEQRFTTGDVEAGYFLVEYYGRKGRARDAIATIEGLRRRAPDDQELLLDLVKYYRDSAKLDAAVALLLELTRLAPSREREAYWQISEIKRKAFKDGEALEWQQKALAKSPSDPTAYQRMAEGFAAMQRFDDAIAAYEKAVQLDPRNAASQFALALLYVQSGKAMKSAELYRSVLRTATEEEVIGRAGQEAINLEEMTDTLGELEKVVAPLTFTMAHKPVYRRVLVELYLRYVPRLIARERHGTDEVRQAARAELARIGGPGLQPLLEALRDEKDPSQQRILIQVLGDLGNPGAGAPLVRIARIEPPKDAPRSIGTLVELVDRKVRVAALVSAGRLGDPRVLTDVLPLTQHGEVAMREAATFTIGRTGDRRAVPALLAALADRRGSVQALACLGLGQIDDPRVAPALAATLVDARREDATRAACAFAIGARKLTAGVPALLAALGDNRGEAQRLAAWALGQLGEPRGLGALVRAYFARAGRSADELVWAIGRTSGAGLAPSPVRGFDAYPQAGDTDKFDAAEAIAHLPGELPSPPVSPRLIVDHADDIANGLLDALREHRDVVVSVLTDLDSRPAQLGLGALTPPATDARATAALATIAQAIAPALERQLVSDDPKVRALAVSVLAKLDGGKVQTAEAAIGKALTDPADPVRAAAMHAVATLGRRRGAAPPVLVASLTRSLASATSWTDRREAALALGQLGPAADPAALIRAATDSYGFVREAVAMALAGIGGPAVLEPLLLLSTDELSEVRAAAARSLATSKDERAVRRRAELARDPHPAVRAAASG